MNARSVPRHCQSCGARQLEIPDRILQWLDANSGKVTSCREIAAEIHVSTHSVDRVLRKMAGEGLVRIERGKQWTRVFLEE